MLTISQRLVLRDTDALIGDSYRLSSLFYLHQVFPKALSSAVTWQNLLVLRCRHYLATNSPNSISFKMFCPGSPQRTALYQCKACKRWRREPTSQQLVALDNQSASLAQHTTVCRQRCLCGLTTPHQIENHLNLALSQNCATPNHKHSHQSLSHHQSQSINKLPVSHNQIYSFVEGVYVFLLTILRW